LKTSRPLFYLIERGFGENSLDQGLRRQAEESGVNILWKHKLDSLEDGYAIVGTGPKTADAIASGIVFKTSYKNIYIGFVDNRIAPQSYAYLLVNNGRATFATCMFKNFKNKKTYFNRALQLLNSTIDIDIVDAKRFSGFY